VQESIKKLFSLIKIATEKGRQTLQVTTKDNPSERKKIVRLVYKMKKT